MKPLNLFNSNSFPSFESVNNNHHWDLLASSFYHTLYNSLPFRLLVLGNQNLSTNYYVYYFSPIYTNLKQYSITNLLLAYTLPFLYIFSPTLIVPAIFVRSLQFFASKTIAIGSSLTSSKYRTSTTSTTSSLFNLSSSTSSGSSSSSSQRSDGGEGGSDNLTSVQDIEYWLQRCSICFDAQLDFCLDLCRDQFCKDCFQRYVKEVVQNSWGLNITKIKCPVCQDVISQSEWSKYVDQTTIDLYNTYNRPYRSYSRCCNECGEEIFAAKVFQVCAEEKEKYFKEISVLLRKFLETYGVNNNKPLKGKSIANSQFATINNINDVDMFIARFEKDYLTFISNDNPGVGVFEMYQYVAKKIGDCLGLSFGMNNRRSTTKFTRSKLKIHSDMVKSAAEISSKIVALEIRPESWKELQFMHVANFPQSRCTKCYNDICLQCGESTHHPGMTCIQFMRYKVANPHLFIMNNSKTQATYHNNINNNTVDALEIIKWKLENSKSCPNCSILINRDDGCNKVDCLHCGYRFCWVCRDGWSEKCGFYQCRLIKQKKTRTIKPRQLSINQRAHNNHHQHHHHHHHHHMQQSAPPPPPAPAQVLPAIPLSPPLLTHHHNNNNDNNNQIIELNNIINNVNNANANIINIININVNINNININPNTNNNNNNMLVSEQIESGMELQELNDDEIEYEDEENYLDEDENDFDDSMIITKNLDDRPEIGVPNVIAIQSKFIANPSI